MQGGSKETNVEAHVVEKARERRRKKAAAEALEAMKSHFPEAFGKIRPLNIGIHKEILSMRGKGFPEMPAWKIKQALIYHTNRPAYLRRILSRKHRVKLDGTPGEPITEKDRIWAKKMLARASRRFSEGSTQNKT